METPSSIRRITRSQTSAFSGRKFYNPTSFLPSLQASVFSLITFFLLPLLCFTGNNKQEQASKSRKARRQRAALLDITNDSPIIGLAAEKTPSWVAKDRSAKKKTPGSGEALLRGQVKTLLEKVEEEAELVNQISRTFAPLRPGLGILPISPSLLSALTPANTPQIDIQFGLKEEDIEAAPVAADSFVSEDVFKTAESLELEGTLNPQECGISRALLFDSPSKSGASSKDSSTASSSIAYHLGEVSADGDSSSNWSLQVNASSCDGEEEEEEAEGEDDVLLDDLCKEMSKMAVKEDEKMRLPEFKGKHTRFVYNSDDEIEGVEEIIAGGGGAAGEAPSPIVTVLKGLPFPEGKHLRFYEEDQS
ncbi:hypothetical protein AXF42_Ash009979 [Apostasia shenzhenica]|uniref:Uncharacterized protein n=1 Tax=Apostasia shenzhenica TaxID=1088818 RepID=A0A2I0ACJ5_9ASPA|nr:hypothetical protein AXF42_Ash009979 [Apostasia shenzhenica]